MAASFGWGFLAASTLMVGGAVALRWSIGERTLGLVMAFGSGVLISAVAFELVQEAWDKEAGRSSVALGLCAGSVTFWAGDLLIDRMGGGDRKHSGGHQAQGSPLAIVLGTVLDGVPESLSQGVIAFVLSFAGGAILTMLADTMMPEAFEHGGNLVGVVTTFGFAVAFAISSL